MNQALVEVLPLVSPGNEFIALGRQDLNLKSIPSNLTVRTSWQRRLGNRSLGREMDALLYPADVHYSLSEPPPKTNKTPKCSIIADLIVMTHPELLKSPTDAYQYKGSPAQLDLDRIRDSADLIHCISHHTERSVHEHLGISSDRTFVAHLGLVPRQIEPEPLELGFEGFILAVGRIDPQKNFARLIEALPKLEDQSLHLVIAGREGWRFKEVYETVSRLSLDKRVHFLHYVSDANLVWLYQNASAFVCPALSEGFGLPVLEAMHYGCPVSASKGGAVPEIVGDTSSVFDPVDPDSIAEGIHHALNHPDILAAKNRADTFTFGKTASHVMEQLRSRF